MHDTIPEAAYRSFCHTRRQSGQLRALRTIHETDGTTITLSSRQGDSITGAGADPTERPLNIINFSSNNYMGLAHHPLLIERGAQWAERWGAGSTASRLVCGNLAPFEQVEARLSSGKGAEAALIFNAGFQANGSILPALLDKRILGADPLVFCDRLNHASMHHGCITSGIRQIRYRHNDFNHLEDLLKRHQHRKGPRFILSETVFSMDGDRADVAALIALKERFGAFLYLDEAHATGVLGPGGFGLAAEHPGRVDLIMGTFSKALGGFGAYVACSQVLRDYLINRCAGFIYSTALPPSVLGAMDAALELLPTLDAQRKRLLDNASKVRKAFQSAALDTGDSTTQIIPVIVGSENRALRLAEALEEAGILGMAIRPPTVPGGSSRIRLSLSAAHSDEAIDHLIETLPRLARAPLDPAPREPQP